MADSGFARQTLPQLITTIRSDVLSRLSADQHSLNCAGAMPKFTRACTVSLDDKFA